MNNMTPFLQKFNEQVTAAEVFIIATRSSKLQKETLSDLNTLYEQATEEKRAAQANKNEEYANILLGCQCVIMALASSIAMWLFIKEGDPDKAWDKLIEAQNSSINAMRASDSFNHVGSLYQHLSVIEQLVFPPQVFISSGMIAQEQTCSICNKNYEDCEHIVCMPYNGEFCSIRMGKFEADHVAIVKSPVDKRCRVVSFDDGDITRNKMTWEASENENKDAKEGNSMTAIILRAD